MKHESRGVLVVLAAASVLISVVSVVWTVWALGQVKLAGADDAGVLAVAPGLIGAVVGGWGLWVAIQSARRTGETIAATLAQAVLKAETRHYKQLLGGGPSALNAPIDLKFTVAATAGPESPDPGGTMEGIAGFYGRWKTGRLVITGLEEAAGSEVSKSSNVLGPRHRLC